MLKNYHSLFWDFDGVIKDAVEAKAEAFRQVFTPYGPEVVGRVLEHHLANGGLSRIFKIPFYFEEFLGEKIDSEKLERILEEFEKISFASVLACPNVPGAVEYLKANHQRQAFYIVTGTPQAEMERILETMGIAPYFKRVFGGPTKKPDALKETIRKEGLDPRKCLMIGDALQDYKAAMENGTDFLLRLTPQGEPLFAEIDCPRVTDFLGEL